MKELLFTPAALLDLLIQIEELSGLSLSITETIDGNLQLVVGDSVYLISDTNITDIKVDDSVVDTVEDINVSAYEDLETNGSILLDSEDVIESGVIKELAKTLLVGGIVRLTSKLLR